MNRRGGRLGDVNVLGEHHNLGHFNNVALEVFIVFGLSHDADVLAGVCGQVDGPGGALQVGDNSGRASQHVSLPHGWRAGKEPADLDHPLGDKDRASRCGGLSLPDPGPLGLDGLLLLPGLVDQILDLLELLPLADRFLEELNSDGYVRLEVVALFHFHGQVQCQHAVEIALVEGFGILGQQERLGSLEYVDVSGDLFDGFIGGYRSGGRHRLWWRRGRRLRVGVLGRHYCRTRERPDVARGDPEVHALGWGDLVEVVHLADDVHLLSAGEANLQRSVPLLQRSASPDPHFASGDGADLARLVNLHTQFGDHAEDVPGRENLQPFALLADNRNGVRAGKLGAAELLAQVRI